MVPSTEGTGTRTSSTARGRRRGPTSLNTRAILSTEPSTAQASSHGPMGLATRASSSSTISAGTASTDGETSGATEARGRTIRCMEAENSPGQMAVSM